MSKTSEYESFINKETKKYITKNILIYKFNNIKANKIAIKAML